MWQEYYKLPLKVDEYCDIITWTADRQRAFDWCVNIPLNKKQELVDVLNNTIQHSFKYKFYREGIGIYSDNPIFKGEPVILIRGWGYLTGCGACNLDSETAAKIQDAFGDYIVEQLNKNVCSEYQNQENQ